ncbi:class I SAM-dependent methyltransferase [Streptomyces turgidiscabies]|uniref:Methyltransferase domain protein n=1 Tax=Streptomyces turgidiscabies (strain Car8) TaxID=698760 RepID=L7F7R9_STRT8|nr:MULTISPECIES: class I SAM-dependent methyltransferase [Streptomyces]ELP66730.1 methyltransferase domain protein [Streptomyces turgidiscabies Car8]MDX3497556.1 class I SAM-dependent methyltransferase [Streptomyces turgidiscabies]GAQ72152.1 ubiquinone biosynthesis O-methyltransferase [Streptomyces turgidiscabies]
MSPAPKATVPPETDGFHEPRREDCPWCGSKRLRTRLRTPDLRQRGLGGPGTFVVDECRDCAHAFQNPRLTAEGLALHHQDLPEASHPVTPRRHRAAARAMLAFREPESWLDVGTGDGAFPAAAKRCFPYTAFDGVDTTRLVQKARTAGHIEEAYRGRLTDPAVVNRLRARYDVVSMFHHLEHTPDPREELRAALSALRPGGHLLIEVPDPHCAFGTLLGKWWPWYAQPRHLHLMPLANLVAELESQHCTIIATDRREPHIPYDLTGALSLALTRVLPARRTLLLRAATPFLALTTALDYTLAPVLRRTRFANTYRIIARRNETEK